MNIPVVAIVGRPNVGKSSLFNRLVGKKTAIVAPTPGVTRDRISSPCCLSSDPEKGPWVELFDTGGMGIIDSDDLTDDVEAQISYAIDAADLIIFLVDARSGAVSLDRHVAERLRKLDKPIILAANKVDTDSLATELGEMNSLGFGSAMELSAAHGRGINEIRKEISSRIKSHATNRPDSPVMKLAIVGKRNAGKSTLINALSGSDRLIVSTVPGTTRDSVDVRVEIDGRTFVLIDTAGVRKKRKISGDIEFYSMVRAMRSINRADVVLFMIDASVKISKVDKLLAGEVAAQYKPVILVVNKWDLATDQIAGEDYGEYFEKTFPQLKYAPISLTTATEGANIQETVNLAEQLFEQAKIRVPTPKLNKVVEMIFSRRGPSHKKGTKPPKILYASQISTAPPTIICFVNDVRSFDEQYRRYLVNKFRELLPFDEIPIRLFFRQRRIEKKE